MSTKSAGNVKDDRVGEGGRVGTVQEGVWFITHVLNGKTRGAIALVKGGVCVVIGKVEVGWDVGGGLGAKAE